MSASTPRSPGMKNRDGASHRLWVVLAAMMSVAHAAEPMADLDAWTAAKLMGTGANIGNTLENTTHLGNRLGQSAHHERIRAEPRGARIQDGSRAGGLGHLRAQGPDSSGQAGAGRRGRGLDHGRRHVRCREHSLGRWLDRFEPERQISEDLCHLQRRGAKRSMSPTGTRLPATSRERGSGWSSRR